MTGKWVGFGRDFDLNTGPWTLELITSTVTEETLKEHSRPAGVGCGGSGKSRLARVLGARLGITPVHLDALYYAKDWKPLNQETFATLQRELVTAPRWIIDGNYASTLPVRLEAADTVIFLDLPGWACLRGIAVRRLRHGGGQHQAIGVYDRITWGFVRYSGSTATRSLMPLNE